MKQHKQRALDASVCVCERALVLAHERAAGKALASWRASARSSLAACLEGPQKQSNKLVGRRKDGNPTQTGASSPMERFCFALVAIGGFVLNVTQNRQLGASEAKTEPPPKPESTLWPLAAIGRLCLLVAGAGAGAGGRWWSLAAS